ncbi:hypothetical protein HCG49_16990 [Arenibacter sp. 6A1]|uniref:hypothetical protein n=1 Tax=Arenibacter sp. 6A1 TaxID=2720391 RepID=UPI001445BDC6|nr:hypothetical protein [Arenibacter sp. 6A1]NKI28252.1 hypothetical protein [Arenibacter sp. 6A1]
MNKEQLLKRAQELGIQVPDGATNPQIEDLIKIAEHSLLKAENKELANELATANELIEAQEAKINALGEAAEDPEAVTYEKGKAVYKLTGKAIRFKGVKYTAEEAVKNEELMTALIKSKHPNLKKQ